MSLSELGEQSETKGEIMRKIKAFTVMMHWDDGEVQNVTMDIPSRIWSDLETMADMMEADDARDRGDEEPYEVNNEAQEQEYTCPKFEPAQEEV